MNALSVSDLTVRLGRRIVLEGLSFELPEGSMTAVLGPNGSGKSTLLRSLLGLVKPERGSIRISGMAIGQISTGLVGYIPQIKSLDRTFPARSEELIASAILGIWPRRLASDVRKRVHGALARVGAEHLADRPIGGLSGGELQRVYLARAFVRSARILLLDEPETGIDAAGSHDLHLQLESYRKDTGATVLVVTHDWDVALHHATHALLLRNRQIAFGPPAEALTEECVRAAFGHVGHAHAMVAGSHD